MRVGVSSAWGSGRGSWGNSGPQHGVSGGGQGAPPLQPSWNSFKSWGHRAQAASEPRVPRSWGAAGTQEEAERTGQTGLWRTAVQISAEGPCSSSGVLGVWGRPLPTVLSTHDHSVWAQDLSPCRTWVAVDYLWAPAGCEPSVSPGHTQDTKEVWEGEGRRLPER